MKTMSPHSLHTTLKLWSEVAPTSSLECLNLWVTVAKIESSRDLESAPLSAVELATVLPGTSPNSISRFLLNLSVRRHKSGTGLVGMSLLQRNFSPLLGSREHAISLGPDGRKLLARIVGKDDIQPRLFKGNNGSTFNTK